MELAPRQDRYHLFLGQAYLRKAQPVTDQRPVWFGEAQEALERAREISPLDPDHYANLGAVHHHWAEVTADSAEAAERLKEALAYYQQAVTMSAASHGRLLKQDRIRAHLALAQAYTDMGEFGEAFEELEAARDLGPTEEEAEVLDNLIARLRAQQQ